MPGRRIASLLLTCCLLGPGVVSAQWAGGMVSQPAASRSGSAPPIWSQPGTATMSRGGSLYEQQLPIDRGWNYEDTQLDRTLQNVVRNSWIRMEYLLWNTKAPGDHLMGAKVLGVADPRLPFAVSVGGVQLGTATVPALDAIDLRDNNGGRMTLGIRLATGSLEASVYGFRGSVDYLIATEIGPADAGPTAGGGTPSLPKFISTSTLTNGQVGNNQLLYDKSYEAKYSSDLWGAEINFVRDSPSPGEGVKLQPVFGVRYFKVTEGLHQVGVFDGGFDGTVDLDPPLVSTIGSHVDNEIFAPQFGLRIELVHRWFSLAFEPRVAAGVNSYRAMVFTDQLTDFADPRVTSSQAGHKIALVGDFRLSGKLRITESVSLFVGYDLMIASGISRAHDNVYYNDNGEGTLPAIRVAPGFETMWWQGLAVGAEIRFR